MPNYIPEYQPRGDIKSPEFWANLKRHVNRVLKDASDLIDSLASHKADAAAHPEAFAAHKEEEDPHPGYLTPAEGNAAYDALGAATGAVSAHESEADPHPGYLTPAEGNAAYDVKGAAATAVDNHEIASDPHGQYINQSRGDARYMQIVTNILRIPENKTPLSATDTGTKGDICWDSDYIYVCVATNTWKRVALTTW
jgi:hypothetical protein